MRNSRRAIETFLAQPALALAGASRSDRGFGSTALRALRAKGYRVYSIHPEADLLGGEKCYRHFYDMPKDVGGVLVVVPPLQAVAVVRDAVAAGIRRVWLQQGAESPYVLSVCRDLGIEVIAGECILMFAKPTGIHKAHHWIQGVFGRLPA